MRKWIFVFLLAGVLVAASSYLFIPTSIKLSASTSIKVSPEAAYRLLLNDATWERWWPEKNENMNPSHLSYQNVAYRLDKKLFNAFLLDIEAGDQTLQSNLILLPLQTDSLGVQWSTSIEATKNPFTRLKKYFEAKTLKSEMSEILSSLKTFLQKRENVYGMNIRQTKVKDSVLVATRITSNQYPTTQEIYALVQTLKKYIAKEGARETDYPMLNIDSAGGQYSTMVAIPTDTLLVGDGETILLKRMVLGNILVAEVSGGQHTIKEAFRQMEFYVDDYNKTSPAIPYESLVTDRLQERDTAKWVTKIYYPVF